MNGLVTSANAGTMPVIGMPATIHPASQIWQAATPETRLPLLADHAQLGLFSVGDIVMLFGGSLVLAICVGRASQEGSRNGLCKAKVFRRTDLDRLTIQRRRSDGCIESRCRMSGNGWG